MDRHEADRIVGVDRRLLLLVARRAAIAEPPDEPAEGECAGRLQCPRGVENLQEVRHSRLTLGLERVGGENRGLRQEPLDDGRRRHRIPFPVERPEERPRAGKHRISADRERPKVAELAALHVEAEEHLVGDPEERRAEGAHQRDGIVRVLDRHQRRDRPAHLRPVVVGDGPDGAERDPAARSASS